MFNQYPESKDFEKITLSCLADKRVYSSVITSSSTNLAIIKIPTRQFKNDPALLFGAESSISGIIVCEQTGGGATGPNFCFIDGDAYTLFKRARVLHGSTVLNDLSMFAQYAHCEDDMTLSPADKHSRSITHATSDVQYAENFPTYTITLPGVYTPGPTTGTYTNTQVFQNQALNSSQMGYSPTFAGGVAYIPFSINLKNFLGNAIDHPIPLHLLTNNDLILEIELETCQNIQICDNTSNQINSISICELQYNAVISKIPWSVSQLLFPNNEATLIGIDKRNDFRHIPQNVTTINVQYDNFKYHYARAVIFFFTNLASRNDQTKAFITQRQKGYICSYNLMYNNKTYPNKRIDNVADMFNQTLKCFESTKSSITYLQYSNNQLASSEDDYLYNTGITDYLGPDYTKIKRFIGGVNLQRYHSDDKHFRGIDISDSALSLNIDLASVTYSVSGMKTVTPQPLGPPNCYLVSYCIYDVKYVITNGDIKVID